jgi:hypothetical protein
MEDRNILWLVFTQSDWRVTIVDWYDVVGRLVAEFRAAMAEHLDDAAYVEGGSSPGCSAPHRSSPPSGSGTTSRASRAAPGSQGPVSSSQRLDFLRHRPEVDPPRASVAARLGRRRAAAPVEAEAALGNRA